MLPQMPENEEEWQKMLTPEEYAVLREGGTEAPFSGEYLDEKTEGTYSCKACGNQLFSSDTKFKTKIPGLIGWPSFEEALPGAVKFEHDDKYSMNRTEVLCARCNSHLGHVFDDGKAETSTGKHYCVNSVCLNLEEK